MGYQAGISLWKSGVGLTDFSIFFAVEIFLRIFENREGVRPFRGVILNCEGCVFQPDIINLRVFQLNMQLRIMDDFLSDITEQMIEKRLTKMKQFLKQEHEDIIKKIQEQSQSLLNSKKNKNSFSNFDEVQRSLSMFHRACEHILETYFTLLGEDQFLSLQSEQEVNEKIFNLKAIVDRNVSNLVRRLNRPKEEILQKDKKIKKEHKRKGKNAKIPLQATSILQKWLLQHFNDPYPSSGKKLEMARESRLTVYQVNNWFINARERVIKRFLKKDLKENPRPASKSQQDQESYQ